MPLPSKCFLLSVRRTFTSVGNVQSKEPIKKKELTAEQMKVAKFAIAYTGLSLVTILLAYYKPDTSPKKWARKIALERLKERGIDPDDYEFHY